MANWAFVENNQIVDTFDSLPKNWKNISNLSASENDQQFLKTLGWYPIEKNLVDCNPSIQHLIEGPITFDGTKVFQINVVENKSIDELYNNFITELRKQRDELLKQSDFMCSIDIVLTRGNNWLQDIANYRQSLRDLPGNYPNNGTIHNIFTIVWPAKPNINDYPKIVLDATIFSTN